MNDAGVQNCIFPFDANIGVGQTDQKEDSFEICRISEFSKISRIFLPG